MAYSLPPAVTLTESQFSYLLQQATRGSDRPYPYQGEAILPPYLDPSTGFPLYLLPKAPLEHKPFLTHHPTHNTVLFPTPLLSLPWQRQQQMHVAPPCPCSSSNPQGAIRPHNTFCFQQHAAPQQVPAPPPPPPVFFNTVPQTSVPAPPTSSWAWNSAGQGSTSAYSAPQLPTQPVGADGSSAAAGNDPISTSSTTSTAQSCLYPGIPNPVPPPPGTTSMPAPLTSSAMPNWYPA